MLRAQSQPQLWRTPPCEAQQPSPHTQIPSPSLLASVLCRAGLQVLVLPQREGSSGLWVGARCAEPHSSPRLGPGVCPGCFWGGLPLLLFTPPWADPSMGTLTWTLHWASRARGWGSDPSLEEVDGVSPSEATSGGKLCNDSNHQPGLLGVFQAGPGQYGCCFCPLEFLLPAETCVCSDTHPGGRRHLLGRKVNLGSQRCLGSPHPAQPALPWGGDATGPQASDCTSVLLEADTPRELPVPIHRERTQGCPGGIGELAGPCLGLPCFLPVPSGKGPEASSGVLSQRRQQSHTLCL